MLDIFDNPDAFEPMLEKVIWHQRKAPSLTKIVKCVIFHGRKEIEAYSSMQGVIKRYSDTWTVTVPISETTVANFAMGDTLERMSGAKEVLCIQNVIKEDGEWVLSVTNGQKMSVAV